MTGLELTARLADPDITPAERAEATRAYAVEAAADVAIEAYGKRVWPIQGGAR